MARCFVTPYHVTPSHVTNYWMSFCFYFKQRCLRNLNLSSCIEKLELCPFQIYIQLFRKFLKQKIKKEEIAALVPVWNTTFLIMWCCNTFWNILHQICNKSMKLGGHRCYLFIPDHAWRIHLRMLIGSVWRNNNKVKFSSKLNTVFTMHRTAFRGKQLKEKP